MGEISTSCVYSLCFMYISSYILVIHIYIYIVELTGKSLVLHCIKALIIKKCSIDQIKFTTFLSPLCLCMSFKLSNTTGVANQRKLVYVLNDHGRRVILKTFSFKYVNVSPESCTPANIEVMLELGKWISCTHKCHVLDMCRLFMSLVHIICHVMCPFLVMYTYVMCCMQMSCSNVMCHGTSKE